MYSKEEIGANVPDDLLQPIKGKASGVLSGLDFMVKDLFAVTGHKTGNGSPDFLAQSTPAQQTAPLIQKLIDNGACLTGITICDEFFYSLSGINAHYGSPVNVRAKERMAGGSSSGSAASVAASLCDFSIGSDTGGSVRVPAAFCGLFGIRPTHNSLDLSGATAMAPSFDTPGWFTRDADLLKIIGEILLPAAANQKKASPELTQTKQTLHLATDAFAQATDDVRGMLMSVCALVSNNFPVGAPVEINPNSYLEWREAFRIIQAYEVKSTTLKWVKEHKPTLGPGIKERFEMADKITDAEYNSALMHRSSVESRLDEVLSECPILLIPTAPVIAPLVATPANEMEIFRQNTMALTCIAGLTGLPQVTLPVAEVSGCPVGLSMIGKKHSDLAMLELACNISKSLNNTIIGEANA